jgi:hypothetical protein
MTELFSHGKKATERQAARIIKISELGNKRGIRTPQFSDTNDSANWLETQWQENNLDLSNYSAELHEPIAIVSTEDARVAFYELNQNTDRKKILVYLPSFTTSPTEGYSMLHYANLAQNNRGIPCISFDYPLTRPSTLINHQKNKLQITAEALHKFLNTHFPESEIIFIGNSQGALTSALTMQLSEANYTVTSMIALDPPTLRPANSWQLGYRGFWDAGDDSVRKHFPNNFKEVWDPAYVWNIYDTAVERMKSDMQYLQRAFLNGRYGFIHDISMLNLYQILARARDNHSALKAKILFGLAGTINGSRTEEFLRKETNQIQARDLGLDGFMEVYGIPTATHSMMQNLGDMAEIAREIMKGGLPKSIEESKLIF